MNDKLSDWLFYAGSGVVSAIVWLVRLEGKASENTRDIERMQSRDQEILDRLTMLGESVSEIKGYLKKDVED